MNASPAANYSRLVPISEARAILGGISKGTIYNLLLAGELTRVHIGRRAFITQSSLADYLARIEHG